MNFLGKSDEGDRRNKMAKSEQQDEAGAGQKADLHGGCHGECKKRVCTVSTLSLIPLPLIQLYLLTHCTEV